VTLTGPEVELLYAALDALITNAADSMIDGHANTRQKQEIASANDLTVKIRNAVAQ
jgi:hypothetical protein